MFYRRVVYAVLEPGDPALCLSITMPTPLRGCCSRGGGRWPGSHGIISSLAPLKAWHWSPGTLCPALSQHSRIPRFRGVCVSCGGAGPPGMVVWPGGRAGVQTGPPLITPPTPPVPAPLPHLYKAPLLKFLLTLPLSPAHSHPASSNAHKQGRHPPSANPPTPTRSRLPQDPHPATGGGGGGRRFVGHTQKQKPRPLCRRMCHRDRVYDSSHFSIYTEMEITGAPWSTDISAACTHTYTHTLTTNSNNTHVHTQTHTCTHKHPHTLVAVITHLLL